MAEDEDGRILVDLHAALLGIHILLTRGIADFSRELRSPEFVDFRVRDSGVGRIHLSEVIAQGLHIAGSLVLLCLE